jgi:DNA-binding GntR family transcriptional regulator
MKKSLRESVYKKIKDEITYGVLFPGQRLIESELTKEFNASRSPIREALRQLEGEGYIIFNRNKGITVSKLSIKEVNELFDLRCLLESYAAGMAAERVTKKQRANLKDLQEKLRTAASKVDLKDWLHNNVLFHTLLYQNSGNNNLIRMIDTLNRRTYRYKYMIVRIPGHFKSYLKHHDAIIKGCEKKDREMVEKFMKLHLETIKDVLIGDLEKLPLP